MKLGNLVENSVMSVCREFEQKFPPGSASLSGKTDPNFFVKLIGPNLVFSGFCVVNQWFLVVYLIPGL